MAIKFEDSSVSAKGRSLTIFDDECRSEKKDTSIVVHPPLIGQFADLWKSFEYPQHLSEWSIIPSRKQDDPTKPLVLQSSHHEVGHRSLIYRTLARRILKDECRWDSNFKIIGEFAHVPCYWEWLESVMAQSEDNFKVIQIHDAVYASLFLYDADPCIIKAFLECWCPTTNTIHMSTGEASISLWDIHKIGGLPITGRCYDEVVPSAKELISREYLPRSCQYLFAAYHHLLQTKKKETITIAEWVKFWYPGSRRYFHGPKNVNYPSGEIRPWSSWSNKDLTIFETILKVKDASLYKEIYAAAFLSCWLCVFVLPLGNHIRPGTFKMASLMASGRSVSLAIPTLAHIYRGLGGISCSPNLNRCRFYLPTHYLYAWIARYFETHRSSNIKSPVPLMIKYSGLGGALSYNESSARKLIFMGKGFVWHSTFPKTTGKNLSDEGKLSTSSLNQFISMRSSYLTFRYGKDHVVESYSPHRFGRQFGFHQDIPGHLVKQISTGTLEELFQYFDTCTQTNTKSCLRVLAHDIAFGRRVMCRYTKWWSDMNQDFFTKETIDLLVKGVRTSNEAVSRPLVLQSTDRPIHGKGKTLALISRSQSKPDSSKRSLELSHVDENSDENWKHKSKKSKSGLTEPLFENDNECDINLGKGLTGNLGSPQLVSERELVKGAHELLTYFSEKTIALGANVVDLGSETLNYSVRDEEEVSSQCKTLPKKSSPVQVPGMSVFVADQVIRGSRQNVSIMIGDQLLSRLSRLPFDAVLSFKSEANDLFGEIDFYGVIPSLSLRNIVREYMENVESYLVSKESSEKVIFDEHAEEMKKIESEIEEAKQEVDTDDTALESDLELLLTKASKLRAELNDVELQAKELKEQILSRKDTRSSKVDLITSLEVRLCDLKSVNVVCTKDLKAIKRHEELLKEIRSNLPKSEWKS